MSSISPRLLAWGAALVLSLTAAPAAAIPAFARRYETTCQTCHLAYPKLTPFGEAFRRNGYRFPGGGDELSQKESPVALGAEAQRDRFPEVVLPGEIPGGVPLSLAFDAQVAFGEHFESHSSVIGAAAAAATPAPSDGHDETGEPAEPETPTETAHQHLAAAGGDDGNVLDLSGLARLRLLSGASLGDVGAFFAALSFGGHAAVELERASVILTPIDQSSLQIEAGRIEPDLHGISLHRNLFGHQLRMTTMAVAENAFAPEPSLNAVQLSGVAFGRFGWTAGAARNAAAVAGIAQDTYGRLEYKFGGMRLDGEAAEAQTAPWRERSLLLGGSFYRGKAEIGGGAREDAFWRAGVDVHGVFDDWMLDVVAARQSHESPSSADDESRTLDMAYAEVTWVAWPWLFPSLRFEGAKLDAPDDPDPSTIGLFGLTALVRPNLLLRLEGAAGGAQDEHFGFRFANLNLSAAL